MGAMQKLAGLMRRAIEKYDMIQPNDRIAVGVSGGKDSVALLVGLCKLREYIGIPYEVVAITMDPCFGGDRLYIDCAAVRAAGGSLRFEADGDWADHL